MHNTVSLDMSIKNLSVDLSVHYDIIGRLKPDLYIFGSVTALEALRKRVPETQNDFQKPLKRKPYWVIVDSKGQLFNLLHNFRRSSYSGNIIVLISERTPQAYIDYLEERKYDYIRTGKVYVDYSEAFEIMEKKYQAETAVIDSGGVLNSYLFELGLIDRLSVLIMPEVVGMEAVSLFRDVRKPLELSLENFEQVEEYFWLVYSILK